MTRQRANGRPARPEAQAEGGADRGSGTLAPRPRMTTDWPESVRVVGSQPSLWWNAPHLAPDPGRRIVTGRARAAAAVAVGPTMVEELGQSFYLMGLMALVLSVLVGLGLLAVRVLV